MARSFDSRRPPRWAPAALAACALLGAAPAHASEPEPVISFDPEAYPPPETRTKLFLSGLVVTGVFYGAAAGASVAWPDSPGASALLIPVAGPWMKVFQTGCPDDDPNCSSFLMVTGAILAGLDGLGQAGGVGLMLEGLFLPTRLPSEPADTASLKPRGAFTTGSVTWRPVPLSSGGDGLGLGVIGIF